MTADGDYQIDLGVRLRVPYVHVVDILTVDPAAIISPAASQVRLAIGGMNNDLSIEIDWLIEGPEESRLPMRWYVAGRALLPAMTADLVVIRRPWAAAELRLVARYRPPFDGLGAADNVTSHSLTEHTAKTFLDAVARRVTAQITRNFGDTGRRTPEVPP